MARREGLLVGLHFNKFTGGPARLTFKDNIITVTDRRGNAFEYGGDLTVAKRRTEPFFANHWIQLDTENGPVWLTCSKKRALAITEQARTAGLSVEWRAKS